MQAGVQLLLFGNVRLEFRIAFDEDGDLGALRWIEFAVNEGRERFLRRIHLSSPLCGPALALQALRARARDGWLVCQSEYRAPLRHRGRKAHRSGRALPRFVGRQATSQAPRSYR